MSEWVNSNDEGPHRFAEHNVVATFDGPDQARAALVMLERRGVEAGDIELFGPGMAMAGLPVTNDEQRGADMRAIRTWERRGGAGAVVGVVIGAVVGGVVAAILSGGSGAILGSAVAGALLLGALGFLWGAFAGMSVNEQWEETFESTGGVTSVAVHSDAVDEISVALEALREAHARRLAMCGRDGHLREVA